jgi:uncharacterized protein YggE
MSDVTVTVRGEHERRVAPERATVRLAVTADGPERGPVVERVAAVVAPLQHELEAQRSSGAVAEWSSSSTAIWSDRPWNNEGVQLPLVHHASVDVTATFSDIAAMSAWLSDIAEHDGVQVNGVQWSLTPETRAHVEREVAAEAVEVAVSRATAYADALGFVEVIPAEVADLGLLSRAAAVPEASPKMMCAAFASDAGAPGLQLQPEDIVVHAAVEARFRAR